MLWRPRRSFVFLAAVVFLLLCFYILGQSRQLLQDTVSYATRPLWDKNQGPSELVPHFHGEGLEVDEDVCALHGWNLRRGTEKLKVFDAVLMSTELDLLEIRLNELDGVVDYFLIIESNATFTGLQKDTHFANNRQRFSKFENKIVYMHLPGYPLAANESPWKVEANTRDAMTSLINRHQRSIVQDIEMAPLVIMSDLDEIPSRHTINLLKRCDFGDKLHLQLRDYLYSFEWYLGPTSWRASVHVWDPAKSYYRHTKSTEHILADAGWHCSYCFRTIGEYITKMKGFSHADRIAGRVNVLDPKRIQNVICTGKDIFGMLPEAYSFYDLWTQMNLKSSKSAISIPRYLVENAAKFRFLLPGGCERESIPNTGTSEHG